MRYIFRKFDVIIIDDVTTGTWSLALLFWNVALVVVFVICWVVGLATVLDIIDISSITQYLDHDKSSLISQLIKDKSRDLKKLLKCFNGTTTSASNL